jgi:hypothetical protein
MPRGPYGGISWVSPVYNAGGEDYKRDQCYREMLDTAILLLLSWMALVGTSVAAMG